MNRTEIKKLITERIKELEKEVSRDKYELKLTQHLKFVKKLAKKYGFNELITDDCIEEVRKLELEEKLEESGIEQEINQLKQELECYEADTEDETTKTDLNDIIKKIDDKIDEPGEINSIYDLVEEIKDYICSELKIKKWINEREKVKFIRNTVKKNMEKLDKDFAKARLNPEKQ